jgi:hypothetical protein
MNGLLVAALQTNQLWYAVPLVVVVSLVYAATRHEQLGPILSHALRFGGMVVGFMAAVLVVLVAVAQFGGIVLGILFALGFAWWAVGKWWNRKSRPRASSGSDNP